MKNFIFLQILKQIMHSLFVPDSPTGMRNVHSMNKWAENDFFSLVVLLFHFVPFKFTVFSWI